MFRTFIDSLRPCRHPSVSDQDTPMGNQPSKLVPSVDCDIKKFSNFAATDIREWLLQFRTRFPEGHITPASLEALFAELFPRGRPRRFCKALFGTINLAHSEKIDFNELLIALSILLCGSSFERLRWLLRFFDQDRDGVVSRDELTECIAALLELTSDDQDKLAGADAASESLLNQPLPPPSHAIFAAAEARANRIFESLQIQSGFLTLEDFERLAKTNILQFSDGEWLC